MRSAHQTWKTFAVLEAVFNEGKRQRSLEVQAALNGPKPPGQISDPRSHSIKLTDSK